jgi:replicative DNA helicase
MNKVPEVSVENFFYEAAEATEAMAKDEPLFITGNFSNKEGSLKHSLYLQANGGRGLLIEKEEDFKPVKAALDLCKQQVKNGEKTQTPPFIVFYGTSNDECLLKEKVIEKLQEWNTVFIIKNKEILLQYGSPKEALQEAKEEAKKQRILENEVYEMNVAGSLTDWTAYVNRNSSTMHIKTGFDNFDSALGGGLRKGRLYCIGAISSLGKTTFALNIANNISEKGNNVLFFSLEMSKYELMTKSISMETLKSCLDKGLDATSRAQTALHLLTNPNFEESVMKESLDRFGEKSGHLYITEGVGDIGVKAIRESIDKFIQSGRSSPVVFIDYVQILSPFNERLNDKQNMDKNILELKRISRDYDITIIAVSSFNRNSYLSEVSFESFKESGAIEYSSDVLIGMQLKVDRTGWDDSKVKKDEPRQKINEAKIKYPREIELVILKNRMYKAWDKVTFDYYTHYEYFKD